MGLNDKMMASMLGRMSLEKKQEMMLKMMPMMMQDVNMAETMVKMIPIMFDQISPLDLFNLLKKLFPNILKGVNMTLYDRFLQYQSDPETLTGFWQAKEVAQHFWLDPCRCSFFH